MSPENLIDGNAALALVEDELEPSDRHEQLRQLYLALLTRQERFDEFKQLLAAYPAAASIEDAEPEEAQAARVKLNERIKETAFARGLAIYPMGGTVDGKYGDHICIAPPYIATPSDIDTIVERLGDAVDDAIAGLPQSS